MARSPYLAAALHAADWFTHTQVRMTKPHWDANHGRLVYTYHQPTRNRVLGLSWTQGRGIITLLAAWEATGRGEYLQTAIQAGEYIKHLQILDAREPRRFGAIREECPASWYVYPRDALEAAIGLMHLWRTTGDAEWLERARLFGDWFISQAMAEENGEWTKGAFYLYPEDRDRHLTGRSFCLGGGLYFFAQLAKATGNALYLDRAFKPLVATMLRDYVREDGVILVRARSERAERPGPDHHHAQGARFQDVAVNDDACGLTVLVAAKELGDGRCLELARRYADWMLATEYPLPNHAGTPLHALTLLETARATGEKKYADFAAQRLAPLFMPGQVAGSQDPAVEGAFRGEDEPSEYYAPKRCDPLEFVNTRVTAYAAGALFKLDGTVFGPYYSAFDWEKPVRKPDPELLKPYRL
jgi:rhamnogalacturonyl hydrolase YesR